MRRCKTGEAGDFQSAGAFRILAERFRVPAVESSVRVRGCRSVWRCAVQMRQTRVLYGGNRRKRAWSLVMSFAAERMSLSLDQAEERARGLSLRFFSSLAILLEYDNSFESVTQPRRRREGSRRER